MRRLLGLVAAALSLGAVAASKKPAKSYYVPIDGPHPSVVKSPMPHEVLAAEDLPDAFDWRSVNGKSCVTRAFNQNQPQACGCCWAVATTGALSDRFKIRTGCGLPDINLAPQVLLDCAMESGAGSCNGGNHLLAYQYIFDNGITDETCLPYQAVDYSTWAEVPCAQRMCKDCDVFGNCYYINGTKYHVSEFGEIQGESAMKAEIYARGPVACLLYAHADQFHNYNGTGVITDTAEYPGITHVVTIAGWGEEDGIPYWVGRNSFGTRWGAKGWFKLIRGKNALNLESHPCVWAEPHPDSVKMYADTGITPSIKKDL